jgi:hypothetical protein
MLVGVAIFAQGVDIRLCGQLFRVLPFLLFSPFRFRTGKMADRIRMVHHGSDHSTTFECSGMFHNAQGCPQTFQNISNAPENSRDFWTDLETSGGPNLQQVYLQKHAFQVKTGVSCVDGGLRVTILHNLLDWEFTTFSCNYTVYLLL